ncbi:GTP-binding protein [Methylomonas sp. DH-1]|uniref:CobW family GTP-binding protein n=1 Tax=Methylomonas sp. (strain DH-1) TaxID=1727196 RepID=UPI0007C964F4|nr:CobW family GTP-binding protein [Methylomonas sp. DH-1]ANE54694.1 cobalamin biosynthesis protein P47K [Methylomonas sp. DH-1]
MKTDKIPRLPQIPVILLTGFLGSGKTTLLNRLLADGVKTAVIINEFGAEPVDQDLLQRQDTPLTVLSGGCLCCQVKGALAPTLKNLRMAWDAAPDKPFERVVIETSGVASPEPILDTLLRERWLAGRYRLQAVLTTLAIPAALDQLDRFPEAAAQVAWADRLLLTHADLADAGQQTALAGRLQQLAPATPSDLLRPDAATPSDLCSGNARSFRLLPANAKPTHEFRSLSLRLTQAPVWTQLEAALLALLAGHPELLRIKGVIYLAGRTEPVAIQAAGQRLYPPAALPPRHEGDLYGRLVFIVSSTTDALAADLATAFGSGADIRALR